MSTNLTLPVGFVAFDHFLPVGFAAPLFNEEQALCMSLTKLDIITLEEMYQVLLPTLLVSDTATTVTALHHAHSPTLPRFSDAPPHMHCRCR